MSSREGEEDELIRISTSNRDGGGEDGVQQHQKGKKILGSSFLKKSSKITRRAKHLLSLPFRKSGTASPPFPYSHDGRVSYLCFLQPPTIPSSSSSSPPSRPGEFSPSSSYYGFLKSLIEKNDFYSPDCNPHRDCSRD